MNLTALQNAKMYNGIKNFECVYGYYKLWMCNMVL